VKPASLHGQLETQLALLTMLGGFAANDTARMERALRPLISVLNRMSPGARRDAVERVIVPTLECHRYLAPVLARFRALTAARVPLGYHDASDARIDALRRHIAELDALRDGDQEPAVRVRMRGKLLEACRRVVRQMPPEERAQAKDLIARAVEARRQQIAEVGA